MKRNFVLATAVVVALSVAYPQKNAEGRGSYNAFAEITGRWVAYKPAPLSDLSLLEILDRATTFGIDSRLPVVTIGNAQLGLDHTFEFPEVIRK